ncbi:MAG: TIGR03790 family protein [Planctomycetes bacterium]|nr:TIGR03790 family protein [Planctomycetota bacterium]
MRPLFCVLAFACASPALALEPKDVWLVVNKNVPASREVTDHYIAKRGVPKGNVVELDLPKGEDISRADYDTKLAAPLRAALKEHKDKVKVLVTTYGVPLRVGQQLPNEDEKLALAKLRPELAELRKKLADLREKKSDAKDIADLQRQVQGLEGRERVLTHAESQASVDSELMLLWWEKYGLVRWVSNPLSTRAPETYRKESAPVVLVSRLDGPTVEIAKRLVDDAIATEKAGLKGKVVIDARGIKFDPKNEPSGTGYAGYDESMREAAALLEKAGLTVELDDKPEVLKPGAAKDVALYCGWYSHANFVDCCEYARGAVAWHLASSEAVTLRNGESKVWCPNLLKKGVCATLGPVAEPYTVGFPKPAEFFGLLATGEYTLVECYGRSMLFCSWMTVLVGDPLYNPYKGAGKLKASDVH